MEKSTFDQSRHKWREVRGDASSSYKIRHDYTILGHDVAAGTLDMVVRWTNDGGHCPIHRHLATTTILVLEGEQHLWTSIPTARAARPGCGAPATTRSPRATRFRTSNGADRRAGSSSSGPTPATGCSTKSWAKT